MSECCVYCGEELSRFERNRAYCWNCRDLTSSTYADDHLVEESELEE